jgi:predicted PurR-regulated permease PerM
MPFRDERNDPDVPRPLRVAGAWSWRLLMILVVGYVLVELIARLTLVVVPVLIATLLSALLSPLVGVLVRRFRFNRSFATAVVVIGGIAAVAGTLYLVISQFVEGAPSLTKKVGESLSKLQRWTRSGPLHLTQQQLDDFGSQINDWFNRNHSALTAGAVTTASTLLEILTGLFLVLFTTFFFLRDGRRISRFLIGLLPGRSREHIGTAADLAWSTLVSYVRATVLVAMIDAIGIGIAMFALEVPFAFPLAALVFLAAFIPIVGATFSGAVAVLVAFVANGPLVALILLAAVIAVQQLEGHVLQPLIMGRAVAIHPLAVILSIATGAVLAGIVGALVAVPTVAVLNTAIRHLATVRHDVAAREAFAHARDDGQAED